MAFLKDGDYTFKSIVPLETFLCIYGDFDMKMDFPI